MQSQVMSLNHFGSRIKHSYLRIYGKLVWKEFSRSFSNCYGDLIHASRNRMKFVYCWNFMQIMWNVNWRLIGLLFWREATQFSTIRFGSLERDYSLSKAKDLRSRQRCSAAWFTRNLWRNIQLLNQGKSNIFEELVSKVICAILFCYLVWFILYSSCSRHAYATWFHLVVTQLKF